MFDSSSTPYVAFKDNSYAVRVMQYNGSNWLDVGTPGWGKTFGSVTAAFDANDVLYVAFVDSTYRVKVMTFNAQLSSWSAVGSTTVSAPYDVSISLAFNSNNMLYAAFPDAAFNVRVMKYSSSAWLDSGMTLAQTSALSVGFVLDSNDVPTVAFSDIPDNDYAVRVLAYNGSGWADVSSIDAQSFGSIALEVSHSNLYVAFVGQAGDVRVLVNSYSGWADVSSTGAVSMASSVSLAFDSGVPFLAFSDIAGSAVRVIISPSVNSPSTYWSDVGNLQAQSSAGVSLDFALSNGAAYLAYQDLSTSELRVLSYLLSPSAPAQSPQNALPSPSPSALSPPASVSSPPVVSGTPPNSSPSMYPPRQVQQECGQWAACFNC